MGVITFPENLLTTSGLSILLHDVLHHSHTRRHHVMRYSSHPDITLRRDVIRIYHMMSHLGVMHGVIYHSQTRRHHALYILPRHHSQTRRHMKNIYHMTSRLGVTYKAMQ